MVVIPLVATPSQTLSVLLGGQNCNIRLYEKSTGVFFDLDVDSTPVASGVICRDRLMLVRRAYLGFVGDLVFCDTQGTDDPDSTGFGARFQLVYIE